jgi:hypothetical protein
LTERSSSASVGIGTVNHMQIGLQCNMETRRNKSGTQRTIAVCWWFAHKSSDVIVPNWFKLPTRIHNPSWGTSLAVGNPWPAKKFKRPVAPRSRFSKWQMEVNRKLLPLLCPYGKSEEWLSLGVLGQSLRLCNDLHQDPGENYLSKHV